MRTGGAPPPFGRAPRTRPAQAQPSSRRRIVTTWPLASHEPPIAGADVVSDINASRSARWSGCKGVRECVRRASDFASLVERRAGLERGSRDKTTKAGLGPGPRSVLLSPFPLEGRIEWRTRPSLVSEPGEKLPPVRDPVAGERRLLPRSAASRDVAPTNAIQGSGVGRLLGGFVIGVGVTFIAVRLVQALRSPAGADRPKVGSPADTEGASC